MVCFLFREAGSFSILEKLCGEMTSIGHLSAGVLEALAPKLRIYFDIQNRCEEEIKLVREERAAALQTLRRQLSRLDSWAQVRRRDASCEANIKMASCFGSSLIEPILQVQHDLHGRACQPQMPSDGTLHAISRFHTANHGRSCQS